MMRYFILFLIALQASFVRSQNSLLANYSKPALDTAAINRWISLGPPDPVISNDGRYFSYTITNKPFGEKTLVIQRLRDSLVWEFVNGADGFFSSDNKQFIFTVRDTLFFFRLDTGIISRKICGVVSFKRPGGNIGKWLALKLNEEDHNRLILMNLITGKEQTCDAVEDYLFSDYGDAFLIYTKNKRLDTSFNCIKWFPLKNGVAKSIFERNVTGDDYTLTGFSIDRAGKQLAFIMKEKKNGNAGHSIWYYNEGKDSAILKVHDLSLGIESGLLISNSTPTFSKDGKYIFFALNQSNVLKPANDAANIDVWNYKDIRIQALQLNNMASEKYSAVIGVESQKVVRVQFDNEMFKIYPYQVNGDYIVVRNDIGDRFWLDEFSNRNAVENYLVSLNDGSRKVINTNGYSEFYFSPTGRYMVYYSSYNKSAKYYSYDIRTGKTFLISGTIPNGWLGYQNEFMIEKNDYSPRNPIGIACWLESDKGFIVYDNYDLWMLDLEGNRKPICLTNGFGRSHNIKFRLVYEKDDLNNNILYNVGDTLLLHAFNNQNKYNGFYKIVIGNITDPSVLIMGPWTMYLAGRFILPLNSWSFNYNMKPLKAESSNLWIIERHSATESPNYFLTTDFKKYQQLTNLQPQKAYNWLKTEPISWKQLDGTFSQGVLYKPENFDPNRTYPLIIFYYEQLSHRLYQFPTPGLSIGPIDITWFVSRGYLVFTPDIYFVQGKRGQSAYNSIISAALYLSILPYINPKRIGINGHSRAGFKTNYLITHSNLFAAALSGAGVSSMVESALSLDGFGSRLGTVERSIGATLWEKQELYLENSPILEANKINTPLLIFHCKADAAVPWQESLSLFLALRRLEKPVWMLQYDDGNHVLELYKDKIDYTFRITQFFDHYLKGSLPPKWMTEGIPASLKGIESGLELDITGICSKTCKICNLSGKR